MPIYPWQWACAALASSLIGLSKTGIPGLGILGVALFTLVFDPKESVGIVLPMVPEVSITHSVSRASVASLPRTFGIANSCGGKYPPGFDALPDDFASTWQEAADATKVPLAAARLNDLCFEAGLGARGGRARPHPEIPNRIHPRDAATAGADG